MNSLENHLIKLKKIVFNHLDIFRTSFSSGSPVNIKLLKIYLGPDAKLVRVNCTIIPKPKENFYHAQ